MGKQHEEQGRVRKNERSQQKLLLQPEVGDYAVKLNREQPNCLFCISGIFFFNVKTRSQT
jgi:hypothetical protein